MIPKSGYLFSGKTIFSEFQPCRTERGTGHAHLHSEAATMERALFTACLHAALARLRTRANDWPMKRGRRKHRPQFDQRVGKEGQLSKPEQNEMVAEAAGPSQHLLPASSKAASGTSKLSVSSSKSAVIDSVMMDHPFLRPIKDNQKRKTSQIVLWALARDGIGGKSWIATDGHGGGTRSVIGFSVSQILAVTFLRVWRLFLPRPVQDYRFGVVVVLL
jgi:hypothetical protein